MSELIYRFNDELEFRIEKKEGDPRYFLTDGFNEETVLFTKISMEPVFPVPKNGDFAFDVPERVYGFMLGFNMALKESSR